MTTDLTKLSLHEAHDLLQKRKISSVELTKSYFDAIERRDPKINAYLTRCPEIALQQATAADQKLKQNKNITPLTGIPIGLKDIFLTRGIRTTCSSKILEHYIPPYNATVVQKLEDAGAVLLGKLDMDEFAMGSSSEHSAFGQVKNPWDVTRTPGGSSGGSAAAVAADLCAASLGTDTGGSVRQPASMCGIVGMKPTYGRISRYGIIAFASSLDQVGPMTKDVTDCALMMNTIAGRDPHDATSLTLSVPDYTRELSKGIQGMKIGIPKEYFIKGIDPEIESAVRKAIATLKDLGANIHDISLPHTAYAVPAYYIIAPAEASSNLARYDGVRYGLRKKDANDLTDLYETTRSQGFGDEVRLRILIGTFVLSSGYYDDYYRKAQQTRTLIRRDFDTAFASVDAIVTPTTPTTAFRFGEKEGDPLKMYLNDIFTIPVNLAGLPGMSLPCGFTKEKLPIGLQLIGPHLGEATLLKLGYAYEQATDWHRHHPIL